MFKLCVFLTALTLSVSPLAPAQPPEKGTADEDPEKALAAAIKLLESKNHVEFVKRFMPPALLAELLEKQNIGDIAKQEIGERAEKWLREFKLVKGTKPVFDETGRHVTFSAKDADGESVRVAFRLVKGKWYLK